MASTSSSVAKPAFGETADIPNILTALDQGTVLIRFFKKRGNRPEKRIFCLKTDTFEILQFPMTRGVLSVSEEKSSFKMHVVLFVFVRELVVGLYVTCIWFCTCTFIYLCVKRTCI